MNSNFPSLELDCADDASVLEVRYEFARPSPGVDEEVFWEQLNAFSMVGMHGGFANATSNSRDSSLEISSRMLASPIELICVLVVRFVDLRAFQYLRNMVAKLRADRVLVNAIRVIGPAQYMRAPTVLAWPDEWSEDESYPEATPEAAGLMSFEDRDFSKVRRMLIVVSGDPMPHIVRLEAWVYPWYQMLEMNAFAAPVGHPALTDSIAGSVSQFDATTVEISVDRFLGTECAWNVLANMVCAFDWEGCRIVAIDVD